jgi:hypothetical protein
VCCSRLRPEGEAVEVVDHREHLVVVLKVNQSQPAVPVVHVRNLGNDIVHSVLQGEVLYHFLQLGAAHLVR